MRAQRTIEVTRLPPLLASCQVGRVSPRRQRPCAPAEGGVWFHHTGGGGGIRTHGGPEASAVFKTAAFDRSATPPDEQTPANTRVFRSVLVSGRAVFTHRRESDLQ